jgi:hypothetical protein
MKFQFDLCQPLLQGFKDFLSTFLGLHMYQEIIGLCREPDYA